MSNSTINNNNSGNEMGTKPSFLGKGIYDIVSVRKQDGKWGTEYIAEVRRRNRNEWVSDVINLYYLFSPNANGPKIKYQPESLINHVINVTECIPGESATGKVYYSYTWKIDTELTKKIQEEVQELESLHYDIEEREYLQEQELIDDQNYQDELDYQQGLEINSMGYSEEDFGEED